MDILPNNAEYKIYSPKLDIVDRISSSSIVVVVVTVKKIGVDKANTLQEVLSNFIELVAVKIRQDLLFRR